MLEARKINWTVTDRKQEKQILKNIDLKINEGECVGLIGPNGSGKSSLLKILALLQPPTSGTILLKEQPLSAKISLNTRRKIAVVFQEPLLLNTTVFQNVATGLKIRRLPKAQITKTVDYWLDAFGISHLSKQHALSTSGGEAQRVSLARAFALNPEILFMDEPFSALDAPTTEDLLDDLNRVFEETGVTTLIVSHDFRDIRRLSDNVAVIIHGEIKAYGPAEEMFSETKKQDPEAQNFLAYWD